MGKKKYEDDDGRQIADMSGIYIHALQDKVRNTMQRNNGSAADGGQKLVVPFSKRETISMIFATVGWALLVGLVFVGAMFLFILFCIHVWFK